MSKPKVRFFPGGKLSVSQDSICVECDYWVQWGEQIWNVEITSVTGMTNDDAHLAALLSEALGDAPAGKLIVRNAGKIIIGAGVMKAPAPVRVV